MSELKKQLHASSELLKQLYITAPVPMREKIVNQMHANNGPCLLEEEQAGEDGIQQFSRICNSRHENSSNESEKACSKTICRCVISPMPLVLPLRDGKYDIVKIDALLHKLALWTSAAIEEINEGRFRENYCQDLISEGLESVVHEIGSCVFAGTMCSNDNDVSSEDKVVVANQ